MYEIKQKCKAAQNSNEKRDSKGHIKMAQYSNVKVFAEKTQLFV